MLLSTSTDAMFIVTCAEHGELRGWENGCAKEVSRHRRHHCSSIVLYCGDEYVKISGIARLSAHHVYLLISRNPTISPGRKAALKAREYKKCIVNHYTAFKSYYTIQFSSSYGNPCYLSMSKTSNTPPSGTSSLKTPASLRSRRALSRTTVLNFGFDAEVTEFVKRK